MNSSILKFIAVAGILLSCILPSTAETNVRLGDYLLGEVTADNINIRSGAGTNFPKAYVYFTDWEGKKSKGEVSPAYKGQRFFVKDAGEWWEINTPSVVNGDSPQYISKKYLKVIDTPVFGIEQSVEPQVWGRIDTVEGYEGDMMEEITIITFYPGNLVVSQYISDYERVATIGEINSDRTAVFNHMNVSLAEKGEEMPAGTPLAISVTPDTTPPFLMMEYGDNCTEILNYKGKKEKYVDLSSIPSGKWIEMAQEILKSPESIKFDRTDPSAYFIPADFSGYIRIK